MQMQLGTDPWNLRLISRLNNEFGSSTVGENSVTQAQVSETNFAYNIRKEVDIAVVVV